ncbi:MAG: hypothetical protein U1F11_09330 [Steroidobacteraceae bacterium]
MLEAVPLYIEAQAMLAHGGRCFGTAIRGVDPAQERRRAGPRSGCATAALEDLAPGSWRILLGALASELGVRRGDSVVLIAPEGVATPEGVLPRMRRFTVAGTFESGMYEFDRGLALVSLADAARLYRYKAASAACACASTRRRARRRSCTTWPSGLGGGFFVSDQCATTPTSSA